MQYGFLAEEELIEKYGHEEILSSEDKKVLVPKNGLLKPITYIDKKDANGNVIEEGYFKYPDAEQIKQEFGITTASSQNGTNEQVYQDAWESASSEV